MPRPGSPVIHVGMGMQGQRQVQVHGVAIQGSGSVSVSSQDWDRDARPDEGPGLGLGLGLGVRGRASETSVGNHDMPHSFHRAMGGGGDGGASVASGSGASLASGYTAAGHVEFEDAVQEQTAREAREDEAVARDPGVAAARDALLHAGIEVRRLDDVVGQKRERDNDCDEDAYSRNGSDALRITAGGQDGTNQRSHDGQGGLSANGRVIARGIEVGALPDARVWTGQGTRETGHRYVKEHTAAGALAETLAAVSAEHAAGLDGAVGDATEDEDEGGEGRLDPV